MYRQNSSKLGVTDLAPKILIVTTVHWPATSRLGVALSRSGFAVGAVAPTPHQLHKLKDLAAGFTCLPHLGFATTVSRAIEQWSPDLIVPGDDLALSCLHELHARAERGLGHDPQGMAALIETSLGDPRHYGVIEKKSEFAPLAVAEGLRVPETVIVGDVDDLRRHMAGGAFPRVLKVDGSWGGLGVRIVHSPAEALAAYQKLVAPPKWATIAKQVFQELNFTPLRNRLDGRASVVTLQAYVSGRPANRAVACWKGEVLAGLSVEVVKTDGATGPASVVRVVDHPEMAEATARLVRRLGISGFCGVDFILDAAGGAHVIELNARTTTLCYLALDESSDMVGALYAQMAGAARRRLASIRHDLIAFFPHELWRDRQSKFLFSAYHDVPWDEPQLIAAYLQPEPPGWIDQLRQMLRRTPQLGTVAPPALDEDLQPLKREG